MPTEYFPTLPFGAVVDYLAEGAANIVYKLEFRPASPQPTVINEYGEGTPPPTEIEDVDDNHFESKSFIIDKSFGRMRCDILKTIHLTTFQTNYFDFAKTYQLLHQ